MNITVYCGSNPGRNSKYAEATVALGEWIGKVGHSLVYGGSSVGLMGLLSHTVLVNGGKVYGIEPQFFIDAGVEQHDLTELYVVETMNQRKAKMIELGDVFVALPGGVGTLEEISEIMSRVRLHVTSGPCFCLDIDGFYEPLRQLIQNMHEQGFIVDQDMGNFIFPKTIEQLIAELEAWQPDATCDGTPVVPEKQVRMI